MQTARAGAKRKFENLKKLWYNIWLHSFKGKIPKLFGDRGSSPFGASQKTLKPPYTWVSYLNLAKGVTKKAREVAIWRFRLRVG